MTNPSNIIESHVETVLLLLSQYPGDFRTITSDWDELFSEKYKVSYYQTTIKLLEPLCRLQDEASILVTGDFNQELQTLKRIMNPSFENYIMLENIKKQLNDVRLRDIKKLLLEIKDRLQIDLSEDKTLWMVTMEADASFYEYRYELSKADKNNVSMDADEYYNKVASLLTISTSFTRRLYCQATPDEVQDNPAFEFCRDEWISKLQQLGNIRREDLTNEHKKDLLTIELEHNEQRLLAAKESLYWTQEQWLKERPYLSREYNLLKQSHKYIRGELVKNHLVLNKSISQHPQKAAMLENILNKGLISTPNALLAYLDCFPWEQQEDFDYFLSMVLTDHYLQRIAYVNEKHTFFDERSFTQSHANFKAIIGKIAAVSGYDYQKLLNEFVKHNQDSVSLLALQCEELLNNISDSVAQKKGNTVYSLLKKLYKETNRYTAKEDRQREQKPVIAYLRLTNQLLSSEPNSFQQKQLLTEYKQLALKAQGKPLLHWQLLGAAMLGLIGCLVGLHVVGGLVGLGIFAAASVRTRESKAMLDFVTALRPDIR